MEPLRYVTENIDFCPYGTEYTCPLHVLAVRCQLQTSQFTQPTVHYTTSTPLQSLDTLVLNHNFYPKPNPNPTYRTNQTTTAGWYSTSLKVAVLHGRIRVRANHNHIGLACNQDSR